MYFLQNPGFVLLFSFLQAVDRNLYPSIPAGVSLPQAQFVSCNVKVLASKDEIMIWPKLIMESHFSWSGITVKVLV